MEEKSVLTGPFCQLTELSFLMQLKCSCQKILVTVVESNCLCAVS